MIEELLNTSVNTNANGRITVDLYKINDQYYAIQYIGSSRVSFYRKTGNGKFSKATDVPVSLIKQVNMNHGQY